jgi:hypothetical protein
MALKRPNVISFSKKNVVHPFEDTSSLEFWATKNDASFFVIAQSTKKRPNNLTFVRTFDGRVLDMCEVGVDSFVSMNDFKVRRKKFLLGCFFTYKELSDPQIYAWPQTIAAFCITAIQHSSTLSTVKIAPHLFVQRRSH